MRAVCLNSGRVVHYDTVKSTIRVKEEDEALQEIVFIIITFAKYFAEVMF